MKLETNYVVDALLALSAGACSVTGILKMPELGLAFEAGPYETLSFIHDWTGVACVVLFAVHILLHARWISHATKKIFFSRRKTSGSAPQTARVVLPLLVLGMALTLPASQELWARGNRGGSEVTMPQGLQYPTGSLKDGTWKGSANGYMPGLSVQVTVKGGKISSISILDNNETPRWLDRVRNTIPAAIIQAQGTRIDAVSGATFSSYGIMAAVENALKGAAK